MIIDKKVSTSFQPPSGRNLFKLFVPELFQTECLNTFQPIKICLFVAKREKKAIVEYLLKRINERSLFVHRQTRR